MLVGAEIVLRLPPENKEGVAGRFPFVATCDKQGLIGMVTASGQGGTHDEFKAILERCTNHRMRD